MTAQFETSNGGVIVAGGGLVGATLAIALDRAGLPCTLVDAASLGGEDASTGAQYRARPIALGEGTRRVFDTLGLWSAMSLDATPIETVHVSERGRFGVTRIHACEHGVSALGYVTPAASIASALDAALNEPACRVERIVPGLGTDAHADPNGVKLGVEIPGSAATSVSGRLLVLADGGRSPLRGQLGARVRSRPYGARAIVATVTSERSHGNIAFERFTRHGPLALLPLSDGASGDARCALVWSMDDESAETVCSLSDGAFLNRLSRCFGGRLGRMLSVEGRAAFPLAREVATDAGLERVLVIGSASQRLHPVAGQGFNLGVRDVAWLAERLVEAARAGGDPGAQSLLARYRTERTRDRRELLWFTDTLVRAFSCSLAPLPPLPAIRSLGLLALDLVPGLRVPAGARLMGLGGGPDGASPRLVRGIALTA